jgi:hypothetical protein
MMYGATCLDCEMKFLTASRVRRDDWASDHVDDTDHKVLTYRQEGAASS